MRKAGDGAMKNLKKNILLWLCVLLVLTGCSSFTDVERTIDALNGDGFTTNYEGPILPLSTLTETVGIEVERNIGYDFSDYADASDQEVGVMVNDSYILKNTTDEAITMSAVYAFAGNGSDGTEILPIISANDQNVDAELVSGRTTERYIKILEEQGAENANDVGSLHERECYELLLSDGRYQQETFEALENDVDLSQPVIVYHFTDVGYDGEEELLNPTAAVLYTADFSKTTVFTYRIDGFGSKDEMEELSFEVPKIDEEGYGKDVYLIVVGEDIDIAEISCYSNMNTYETNRTDAFSVEYEKYESTLEDMIRILIKDYIAETDESLMSFMSDEMSYKMYSQLIYDMEFLEEESNSAIALDGSVFVTPYVEQHIYYQVFELEIPASESVTVNASFQKPVSVSDIDAKAYDRYDVMTELSSNLEFTSQTLTVEGTEYIEFAEYMTGEELENGATEIELKDSYFEILLKKIH